MRFRALLSLVVISLFFFSACNTIDLYEKVNSIPDHEWKSEYKPQFTFIIKDTTVPYQVFFVLRHTEKYNWNNLWIYLHTQTPGDSAQKIQYEIPLAARDRWLGSAMGDIYEHRVLLTPQPIYFKSAGEYKYMVEQTMREDPLLHVLNVGLRVEKKLQ